MHAQPPLPTQAPTQAPMAVAHLAMLPPPQLQQPPDSAPTVEFLAGAGKGVEPLLAGAFLSQPASSMSRKDRVALTLEHGVRGVVARRENCVVPRRHGAPVRP